MKTATLFTYTPYGTSYTAVDVMYRGRLMKTFQGLDTKDLIIKAVQWTLNQGFSQNKIVKDNA